ncbi:tonsoku-like protein [Octopus sinensis]|uniref:Tonsoku-like protein n=1 Tax=Octopus sinensis TaxID=2607531 RepID=A0A6P7TGQ2_9MOLL|nr:tonsoku-like protein [Octopus sinensis]
MSYEVIKLSYLRALNFAREAKNVRLEQRILKLLVQTQQSYKQDKDKKKFLEKLKALQAKSHLSVEDSGLTEEEDRINSNDDDNDDDDDDNDLHNSSSGNEDDVEISDLTESEEDEEEIRDHLPSRRTNATRFKVKRNEKGETPLHRACIEGNLKRVELLIKQGQPINVRDYCGWMPIHEAANLGFHLIVEVLIEHGANIDDVGGKECGHVTPLIDAATNGNIEVMQVLLNHGADLTIKDARDRTALTSLMEWRQNCDDVDEEAEQQYQSMVRYLQKKMGIKDVSVLRQKLAVTSMNWGSDNSDDNDSPPLINETSRKKRDRKRPKDNLSEFIEDDNSTGGSSDSETELRNINGRNIIEQESATDAYRNAMSTVGSSARQRLHKNECSSKSLRRRNKGGSRKTALISSEKYVDSDWLIEDVQPSKRKRLAPRGNCFTTGTAVRKSSECKDSSSSITATKPGSSSSLRRFKSRTYSVIDEEDDNNSNDSSASSNSLPPSNLDINLPDTIGSTFAEQHQFSSENRFGSSFIPESNQEADTLSQIFHHNSDHNLADAANFTDSIKKPSTSSSSSSSLQLRTDNVSSGMVQMVSKVYIKVGTLYFCVPLSPSDRLKTILWLNQETSRRVYAQCQLKPILSLTTKSGALLDPDDKISMVIENGEELEGCVTSWDLPQVQDRYTEACKSNKTVVVGKISQQLEQCETSGDLTLPHMALTPSIILPVFRAIKYQSNLCFMNLTGNRLGDVGLQSLAKVLNTIPSLTSLDISCNGITLKGLKELNSVLEATYGPSITGQQDTVPWGLAKKPLQKLESLNLSYNHLTDECSDTLMALLRHLPALTHLAIASCQLSHTLFEHAYRSQPSLTSSGNMRSCYLQHVDVSCNKLESAGVRLLFKWLDPTQLVSLDLSWTSGCSSYLMNQLFCNSLMNFLPLCEEPKLQKLSLAGCDLSLEDGNLLVRLPYFATRLQTLDLSSNPQFEQPILLQLLQNASSNADCALEQIVMIDCGISSPLTSDFLDSLGNKLSATIPLVKLHFSCVKLDTVDQNSLKQVWCGHWGDLAVCSFHKGDIVQLSVRNNVY